MKYIKPILDKHNLHALDFITYICDERRDLNLDNCKDEELIIIDTNHGSGGKIYIDEKLEPILNDFLKNERIH